MAVGFDNSLSSLLKRSICRRASASCRNSVFFVSLVLWFSGCSADQQGRNSVLLADESTSDDSKSISPQGSDNTEVVPPVNVAGAYLVKPNLHRCFHESRSVDNAMRAICGVSLKASQDSSLAGNLEGHASGRQVGRVKPIWTDGALTAVLVHASSEEQAVESAQSHLIGQAVDFVSTRDSLIAGAKSTTTYRHSSGKILIVADSPTGAASGKSELGQVEVRLGFEPVRVVNSSDTRNDNPMDSALPLQLMLESLGLSRIQSAPNATSALSQENSNLAALVTLATTRLLEASLRKLISSGLSEIDKLFTDDDLDPSVSELESERSLLENVIESLNSTSDAPVDNNETGMLKDEVVQVELGSPIESITSLDWRKSLLEKALKLEKEVGTSESQKQPQSPDEEEATSP